MSERTDRNAELRRSRMSEARRKGRHTQAEWTALKAEFRGRCVMCGRSDLPVERDHVVPVYLGGSDSIDNVQPACARCNARKGPCRFDWKGWRRANGFDAEPSLTDSLSDSLPPRTLYIRH